MVIGIWNLEFGIGFRDLEFGFYDWDFVIWILIDQERMCVKKSFKIFVPINRLDQIITLHLQPTMPRWRNW